MYYVYHKLLNEIAKLADGQKVWQVGQVETQAVTQAWYSKYNHGNEKCNKNDPLDNQEGEKYNEDDPKNNQEGVDPKLVDFLFSSQRRNTDSLQHKGLKWAADDLLCKCAKVQKGQKVQKGKKVQMTCGGEAGGPRARKALQGGSEPRPSRTPKPGEHN